MKIIKNNLKIFVTLIISGIVFTGIGVYAASQYFARDITFTATNENFKKENGEPIDNVEDALNSLYLMKNSAQFESKYIDVQTQEIKNNEPINIIAHNNMILSGYATVQYSSFGYLKIFLNEESILETNSKGTFYFNIMLKKGDNLKIEFNSSSSGILMKGNVD